MVVVGVKDLHDVSGQVLLLHGLLIISLVEGIQVEALHGLRIPDAQGVDDAVAVSDDGHVVGDGLHGLISFLTEYRAAVFIHIGAHPAAELHLFGVFRAAEFEGIAVRQPVVRHFHLIAVPDFLLEHAVAVANAAAVGRIAQGRQGIQEARGQTAQAAIAQRRIGLLILHCVDVQAQLVQSFLHLVERLQVDEVVAQRAAHQEFHGHVIDHFGILLLIFLLRRHPVVHDHVLDRIGHRLEDLLLGRFFQRPSVKSLDIIENASLEKLFIEFDRCFL